MKLLLEFGPIVAFFATYKLSNILFATTIMVIVTSVCLGISYFLDGKISKPLLISGGLLLVSGSITIISQDPKYIKMKPTLVYLIFSAMLIFGLIKNKLYLKQALGASISLNEAAWITLSKRFAIYFFMIAVLNEVIWRYYSEDFWVNFKIFGVAPITVVFIAFQIPFIYKNQINKE
jgi:intracellular septation protein